MNITKEKIQRITNRGQITLPVCWRRKVKTNTILLKTKGDSIEVFPVHLKEKKESDKFYTVFDAIRDNKSRGLRAADLLKLLKRIDRDQ